MNSLEKKFNKEGHPDDINVVETELNLFQHQNKSKLFHKLEEPQS